jgi:hypothetical protein
MGLNVTVLAGAAFGACLMAGSAAFAQQPPASVPAAAAVQPPAPPTATGATTARPASPKAPAKPAEVKPHRGPPRPYAQCIGIARKAGLRGAERRRYVSRCQLGYESAGLQP